MLDTLVAIVLGNAFVAALMALGVVFLARYCHKPALLHGLWVVVLLKLITPPMLTIPVPVQIPALDPVTVQIDEPNTAIVPESTQSVPAATSELAPIPPTNVEPTPTIVIEPPPDVPPQPSESESPDEQLLANLATAISANPESQSDADEEKPLPSMAPAMTSAPVESIGFPPVTPVESSRPIPPTESRRFAWHDLLWPLLWIWGAGALVVFMGAFRQILRFERSLHHALPAGDALKSRVEELALRLGLSRPPVVLLVNGAVSPMLWGFGRTPRLLLPKELLSQLNADAIDTLILHELAHMRRGDHWVRVLELLCQGVYWWHPVVWWGRKQLRIVEEECCDAFVVEHCQGGVYARALLATVDFLSARQRPAMPPAASGMGNLEFLKRRLTMIMQGGVSARLAGLPKFLLLILAVIGLSILPRLVAQTADAATEEAAEEKPEETERKTEQKPDFEPKETAPQAVSILIGQEPIEFEKQPRGYPLAQLEVRDLAFSPNGQFLAAGYGKWDTLGEVVVYDFSTKNVLKKFSYPKGIASVVFSPDGKYLAASVWNDLIQIWNTETWELAAEKNTANRVSRLAFSPDGKYLAAGSEGGQLRLFTVGQWDEERAITGELFRFQKVAFSPDSKLLAAVGGNFEEPRFGRGLIIEVETGKQLAKIETAGAVMSSAAFSPDGKELATGEYATAVRFWEVPTGKAISVLEVGGTMDSAEYTKDGLLVGPSFGGDVHIIKDRQILRSFTGHEGRSLAARMSPDGKTLVSGGIDAMIRIWNPETAVPIGTIRPYAAPEDTSEAVLAMAHSPDGRFVVTTHEDGTVRLRDAKEGTFIKLLAGHEDVVAAVAFSPDSKTLATGSYDQMVKLWNVETGEALRDLKGHTNWVFSVAFSPDGKTLASSGYDKTIRLWSIADGQSQGTLEGHTAAVRSLAFSPNGEQLVSAGSDKTLRLWDLKTKTTVHEMKGHTAAIRAVAFAPSGNKIASGSEDQTIRFWSPDTGQSIQELKGHTGMVWTLAFSPRGRTLASGGFDNTLRIWNGETGAQLQTLAGHQDVITSLSYAPDTSSLITGSYDKTLKRWPSVDPPVPALADLNLSENSTAPNVRFVEFSPDGKRMLTGSLDRSLRLWDLETGRIIKTELQARGISDGTLSPDGKLLVTSDFGGTAYLWNAETLEVIDTIETGQMEGMIVAISPDGQRLATGDWNGNIKTWSLETRGKIADLPKQELPIGGLAFSPDGKLLASATGNYKDYAKAGTVKLWNTDTWDEAASLPGPSQKMRRVEFSPDGKLLVAGGSQAELLVYDVQGKNLTARIPYGTEVTATAFLPDSQTIVLAGYDGSLGLWSLSSKNRIVRYAGHQSGNNDSRFIYNVALAPDASVVASAGVDGHVMLWSTTSISPHKPLLEIGSKNVEAFQSALSPGGSRLVIARADKTVDILDTKTGQVLKTISGLMTSCGGVAFAPDGQTFAGAMQGGRVYVWDVNTAEERFAQDAHLGGARRVCFSPDGKLLASCGWDETAAVWNLADRSLKYRTEKQGLAVSDVKFTPEGKLLLISTGSWKEPAKPGTIKAFAAEDGKFVHAIGGHAGEIKGLATDAGGWHIVSYGSGGAKVWSRFNTKEQGPGLGTGTTITSAAVSPDGNKLYAGHVSGQVLVYDMRTRQITQTLGGHTQLVHAIHLSHDGSLMASASKDGSVKVWQAGRVPVLARRFQMQDDVTESLAVAYSPDGRLIAVGGKDSTISLLDAKTKEVLRELTGHNGMVFRLAFFPDGQRLLTGSSDGTARVWSVAGGGELASFKAHGDTLSMVRSVAVTPDGKRIAAGNMDGETRVWDLESREVVYQLTKQELPISGVTFSPDGTLLGTSTGNWQRPKVAGEVRLWNANTGEQIALLEGHTSEVKGLLFVDEGKTLVTYESATFVRSWDVATKQVTRTYQHDRTVTSAASSGKLLAIADFRGGVALMDLNLGTIIARTNGHFNQIGNLAFSPDGTEFATVSHDGYLSLWSTEISELAQKQLPTQEAGEPLKLAEAIRDWQPLVSSGQGAGNLVRVKTLKPHGEKVWFAVYSPDGKTLATGGDDRTVKLWNAETLEQTATLTGHENYTTHAAFSPQGDKLATVGWDNAVKVWDVQSGRLLASASPHAAGCRRVAFSPDGQSIATACEDGYVRVFNPDLVETLSINVGLNVYSVTFSPDGKTFAIGTGNWREKKLGWLAFYDTQTGKQIKELAKNTGYIFHLQYLKDGKHLLANNAGAGCAIWDVETGEMVETYRKEQDTRWVEISRDEKQIIATVQPGMIQVWNRNETEPWASFKASDKFVHCATFSPDGKRVIITDEAGDLSVWEVQSTTPTQVAESPTAPATTD